jgi:hypothetical protein
MSEAQEDHKKYITRTNSPLWLQILNKYFFLICTGKIVLVKGMPTKLILHQD